MAWLNFLGPEQQHLLIDVSITGVYRDAVLDDATVVVFQASLTRLGRTPNWMRTLDQPALFLSAMVVVIDYSAFCA